MTNRVVTLTAFLAALFTALLATIGHTDTLREVRIAYVTRVDDSFYAASGGYTGIYGAGRRPALAAAQMAVNEAVLVGQSLGLRFTLSELVLEEGESVTAALSAMIGQDGPLAAVLDLPETEVRNAALALKHLPLVLFNIRHPDMELRAATCDTRLFHIIPSRAMLADALVQHLMVRDWREAFELVGESDDDRAIAEAFEASARKYGLKISERKIFAEGNDPRRRDQSNVRLLLAGSSVRVVFIANASREFARLVPYNTPAPALIVGSAGLVPAAWSSLWERHGGPQLNKRFLKATGRPMLDEDWASWAAVRAVTEAVRLASNLNGDELVKALTDPGLRLDLYKGLPGSFRPWNHQLRQPILLTTGEAVVGLSPVENILHQTNILDTLGLDEPEFKCTR